MDFWEVVRSRRSIRAFSHEPVSPTEETFRGDKAR